MPLNKRDLYYKTMTPSFLLKMVGIIIVVCLTISTILNLTRDSQVDYDGKVSKVLQYASQKSLYKEYQKELADLLIDKNLPHENLMYFIEVISANANSVILEITQNELKKTSVKNETYYLASLFLGLNQANAIDSLSKLQELAAKPTRYANRLLAFHFQKIKLFPLIEMHLQVESKFKEASTSRKRLFRLYLSKNDMEKLKELSENPNFSDLHKFISMQLYLSNKSWFQLFKFYLLSLFDITFNGAFILALISGLLWFGLWLHALRPTTFKFILPVCLLAFLAGAFSTVPTLLMNDVFEEVFDFKEREGLLSGVLYYVMSVGFREELCKLICFIPFIPFLVKRGKPLEWLIVAGMVGLGFAAEENLGYFSRGFTNQPGRFLTANVLHVALTALAGEALCFLYKLKKEGVEQFVTTFSMVIVLHGLYDAFIAVPELNKQLGFGSFIALYFMLQLFFKRLNSLRDNTYEPISLTTHFIFAITIIFMSTFIATSYHINHIEAMRYLGRPFINLGIIVYAYLYLMPNSIIKV